MPRYLDELHDYSDAGYSIAHQSNALFGDNALIIFLVAGAILGQVFFNNFLIGLLFGFLSLCAIGFIITNSLYTFPILLLVVIFIYKNCVNNKVNKAANEVNKKDSNLKNEQDNRDSKAGNSENVVGYESLNNNFDAHFENTYLINCEKEIRKNQERFNNKFEATQKIYHNNFSSVDNEWEIMKQKAKEHNYKFIKKDYVNFNETQKACLSLDDEWEIMKQKAKEYNLKNIRNNACIRSNYQECLNLDNEWEIMEQQAKEYNLRRINKKEN